MSIRLDTRNTIERNNQIGQQQAESLRGDMATSTAVVPNTIEASALRKVNRRIMPFVFVLYLINFIDRINIGFAALTMNKELAITSEQFGFLAGIFFFGCS